MGVAVVRPALVVPNMCIVFKVDISALFAKVLSFAFFFPKSQ